MFVIDSSFIGDFKVGDNINRNLATLRMLYKLRNETTGAHRLLLNKPICIIHITIIEAILWDFYRRCKTFTREGVANIGGEFLLYIKEKKLNKFRLYIECADRHDLLKDPTKSLYADLVELSKLRNRVHIQNENGDLEPDEQKAFSEARLNMSEQCLEKVLKILAKHHPRKESVKGFVEDFVLPWDEHFIEL